MVHDELAEQVRRTLREAPFAMRQLSADADLSYDVLRSWRSGRRRPSRGSALRLAEGLERRGERLVELARELKEAAAGETSAPDRGSSEGSPGGFHGESHGEPQGESAGRPRGSGSWAASAGAGQAGSADARRRGESDRL
jgi:hypothetical protein